MTKFFPEAMFEAGFEDLVSVIPPNAPLTPTSKIPQSAVGKVPGRRLGNGLWAGYDWRKSTPTVDDVRKWAVDSANVGLRADRFPGVDIDSTDERLVGIIEDVARATLGPAPVRVGKAPKRLLMYRTEEPFGRMRLWIKKGAVSHLVEVLGQGQQYLIYGTHPSTLRPYGWLQDPVALGASGLTTITREQADRFLNDLASHLDLLSIGTVEREGDGRPLVRTNTQQESLLAPSIEALRDAVRHIPNTNDFFPDRTSYLKMGYAIRAASEDIEEGFAIFGEWAGKWEGNDRVARNEPETILADWRRMRGPYEVGWNWIAEMARPFGFDTAKLDFDVVDAPDEREANTSAVLYSDQWLAEKVVERNRGRLRYVPKQGAYLVWSDSRWRQDAELLAEDIIVQELRRIAIDIENRGTTPIEQKEFRKLALQISSAGKATAVLGLVRSNRAIAVSVESLDHNPWVLNTPAGVIDLKTGTLGTADPDALITKSTAVPADFSGAAPEWKRFLAEATGGDAELEGYLQRFAGYCLTGSTREQVLAFLYGPGGNGKSVFKNVLAGVLGDYARVAAMDTFTASYGDKHSTDVASLVGARFVSASETAAGKRWDEARVSSLTGGEPVTARYMRQDNFTFMPQFKLLFLGNHKPGIRDITPAMRRRIHLVPFTVTPARVDKELDAKLREEWPAILAWMVDGCLTWQQQGLNPPAVVRDFTSEYFREEDAVGRWLDEATYEDEGATATTQHLFESWREWANENGEYVGSMKRFATALVNRKIERWKDPVTRRAGFKGLKIMDRQEFGITL